jgi:hypothetical protein
MPIPITNVSFSAIQTEFGGSNPISLSEYYRGGSNVPIGQGNAGYGLIATSGAIAVGPFRGQTKAASRTYDAYNFFNFNGMWGGSNPVFIQWKLDPVGDNYLTTSSGSGNPPWTSPGQIGIGNTHWARVDISSGSGATFTGTTGTYLQLSSQRIWRLEKNMNFGDPQITYQIRLRISTNSSGTAVVADGTSNWRLTR